MAETKAPTTPEVKPKPCNSCGKKKQEEEEKEYITTNDKGDTTVYRKLSGGRTEILTTHADNTFEHQIINDRNGLSETTVKGADGVQRSTTVDTWNNRPVRSETWYPGGTTERSDISTGPGFDRRDTTTTFPNGERTIRNSSSQGDFFSSTGTTQTRTMDPSGRVTSDSTTVNSRLNFYGAGSANGSVTYGSTVGASAGASLATGQEVGGGGFVQTMDGGRAVGGGVNVTTSAGNGSLSTTYDPVTRSQNNFGSVELGRNVGPVPATVGGSAGYSVGPTGATLGSGAEGYAAGPGGLGRQSIGTAPANVTLDNAAADIARSMGTPPRY